MKNVVFIGLLVFISTLSVTAQSVYFDIGIGVGKATTELDGINVADSMDSSVTETAIDMGLKLGYGPIANKPIYVVGEISAIGHRFEYNYDNIQFNSYLFGPGIIIYPVPAIQIAASLGYSFVSNQSSIHTEMYDSTGGYAGNASIALDLGKKNNGCLLGIRYSFTNNTLEVSEAEQKSSIINAFIKYAYRQKIK